MNSLKGYSVDSGDFNSMPGGPLGALGSAGAAVTAAWLFLRKYLSREAADRADDAGRVSAINVYKELLEAERIARNAADKRADDFARERNEAIATLGKLQGQLEAMQRQLQHATEEISALRAQVDLLEDANAKPKI